MFSAAACFLREDNVHFLSLLRVLVSKMQWVPHSTSIHGGVINVLLVASHLTGKNLRSVGLVRPFPEQIIIYGSRSYS